MQDTEGATARLENVRAVEPLLGALRTISMGAWHVARRHREDVHLYGERLLGVLRLALPHLALGREPRVPEEMVVRSVVLLALGSERGLVGQFNRAIAERVTVALEEQASAGVQVTLWALGSRLIRMLERQDRPPDWVSPLTTRALPSYRLALDVTRRLLADYEAGDVDGVQVAYNRYRQAGHYETVVVRLIPPQVSLGGPATEDPWPPPIMETDPEGLYERLVEQLAAINLYTCLVESATAEHAARFHLMEEATQNAERLIEELTVSLHIARRQAITQEIQELIVGAGLLASQRDQ